jgi:hypothetical protein
MKDCVEKLVLGKDTVAGNTTLGEEKTYENYYLADKDVEPGIIKKNDDTYTYRKGLTTDLVTEGKEVQVVAIKVGVENSWSIMPTGSTLRAKELAITINNLDLSLAGIDSDFNIRSRGWKIAGPTSEPKEDEETVWTPTTLNLPITASIAGNSVNTADHTSVLSVTYTIVPTTNS